MHIATYKDAIRTSSTMIDIQIAQKKSVRTMATRKRKKSVSLPHIINVPADLAPPQTINN